MIVTVMYYVPEADGYGSDEYTYVTDLPLLPHQKVLAPIQEGGKIVLKKALVKNINLPESTADDLLRRGIKLKEIKELDV